MFSEALGILLIALFIFFMFSPEELGESIAVVYKSFITEMLSTD